MDVNFSLKSPYFFILLNVAKITNTKKKKKKESTEGTSSGS